MDVTGESRQEKKIEEMANVVEKVHAGLSHLSVKGDFRLAIAAALKDFGESSWKDIGKGPRSTREKFFAAICDYAIPRIVKIGFPEGKVDTLRQGLQEMNAKYLQE
ncbi:hypothetical protein [Solidesulfovibrio sp. C21]|uniref:hypothetical protein n=1 Tax=Solidesulfovibrio sp. C21 TaxID=3398613 RepID=UPI0039FBC3B3